MTQRPNGHHFSNQIADDMILEEFVGAAGGHRPCVGVLLTLAPLTPPKGIEFRTVDAQQITSLDTLFFVFAEA
jgi:hypothetical protein